MIPRDVKEVIDRLPLATAAFFKAVRESVDAALDDAKADYAILADEVKSEYMLALAGFRFLVSARLIPEDEGTNAGLRRDRYVDEPSHDRMPVSHVQYSVGDTTCSYNALNPELRCAVNPYGPCPCEHYSPRPEELWES